MSEMTLTKKNLKTWFWIRVSWYVRYRIKWIVTWLRKYFRFHTFWWWVLWWWWRVTYTPIWKYWWSGYQKMYRQLQYLSIAQILTKSCIDLMFVKLAGIILFYSVWFESTWVKSESVWFQFSIESVLFQFEDFCAKLFQFKKYFWGKHVWIFLPLRSSNRFSRSFFGVTCNGDPF